MEIALKTEEGGE